MPPSLPPTAPALPGPQPESISLSPALVVEDDPAMQTRLQRLLERVCGSGCAPTVATDVAQAQACLATRCFGVALVDIGLPDGSGIDLIRLLHQLHPATPAVVVSVWRSEEVILAALQAGAIGYLLKERDDLELELALRSIARGGAPIDPAIARRILALLPQAVPAPLDTAGPALSRRERDVLEHVAQGLSNREIADKLNVSRLTIECHTKNIYRKLAVNSRTEAVFRARQRGLLR